MLWQPVDPHTYTSTLSTPLPSATELFSTPGYNQPRPERNPLATTSLVLGFIGLIVPILAVVAIVLGHLASTRKHRVGANLARGGYGLGYVSLWAWLMTIFSTLVL